MKQHRKYDAIVIGVSAGGLQALSHILELLPVGFPVPIIVVQHRSKDERYLLEEVMQSKCEIKVCQADEKEQIKSGRVYFAPPDYHLLIESDGTFSLSCEEPVNFSRPSIDVLFETAAQAYKERLLGIILTGANDDGARGMRQIRKWGGTTIAQKPSSAEYPIMPQAAINTGFVQYIMDLDGICRFVLDAVKKDDSL